MRIGYGYKRTERDFDGAQVDRIWIDQKGSERMERTWMLQRDAREGDTVVLLSPGDLGAGGELPMLRAELARRGIAIEVREPPPQPQKRPGRKASFDPSPEQDAQISALYHNLDFSQAYVLRRASEIMGMEVHRWHLTHRYKARAKPAAGSAKRKP